MEVREVNTVGMGYKRYLLKKTKRYDVKKKWVMNVY